MNPSNQSDIALVPTVSVKDTVKQSCIRLTQSNKTFEDIYKTVFYRTGVLCQTCGEGGAVSYTYKDFRDAVDRVSSAIYKEVGEGSYVAVYGKNSFEWTVAFWAILKSGNKPFLINMLYTREAMISVLGTIECQYVLCTHTPSGLGKRDLLYSELIAEQVTVAPRAFADSIALSTSGTTLCEKICIYSGEVISNQLLNAPHILSKIPSIQDTYEGKLKMLMVLPLYHIFGLEASYLWFLLFGAIFVFPPSLAPSVLLSTVKRYKVTHVFSVPMLWQGIEKSIKKEIESQDEKTQKKFQKAIDTSIKLQRINASLGQTFAKKSLKVVRNKIFGDSVRFCISGGAHIGTDTLRLINGLGYPLYNGYGMTEIGIVCANFTRRIDQRLTESIGIPFDSVQSKVSEEGHLLVKGSSICREMIIDREKTVLEDWFDTGDIVTQNSLGGFEISGRASDLVINSDGENLNPDIAEHAISLPFATSFAVLGNENNDELILVVEIPKNISECSFDALRQATAIEINKLPPSYRIRKVYYTTDALLEANEIKVSRKKLRRRIDSCELRLFDKDFEQAFTCSDSAIEAGLREIFVEVLGAKPDEISSSAHFMNDLGGTSLEYYDVMYRIEERFGVKIDLEGQGSGYTLSDLERIVKEKTNL